MPCQEIAPCEVIALISHCNKYAHSQHWLGGVGDAQNIHHRVMLAAS